MMPIAHFYNMSHFGKIDSVNKIVGPGCKFNYMYKFH